METKLCGGCLNYKNKAEFNRNKGSFDGLYSKCKACKLAYNRAYYSQLTVDIKEVLNHQNGKCAICTKILGIKYCADHNHKTRKFRGLLCHACNTGLGQFQDDTQLLKAAIAYLSK